MKKHLYTAQPASTKKQQLKWHRRFLSLAHLISTWSKDPSTKCGCVIVRPNKTIAAVGFNGLPCGIADYSSRLLDKNYKHSVILHSEENAFLHSSEKLSGYTIYTTPIIPCPRCAAKIIQVGIKLAVA